jgi:hypothetical protein
MFREFNQMLIDTGPVAVWLLAGGLLTMVYSGSKFTSPGIDGFASSMGAAAAIIGGLAILKKNSTVQAD